MYDEKELIELFRKLGAEDPEGWASSQIKEGINQLGRFLFLKQAWSAVVDEDDLRWIDREINDAKRRPNAPFAGVGHALRRLIEAGADPILLTDLVRGMQASLLFDFCSLLDDPGDLPHELNNWNWCLFQVDESFRVVAPIQAVHESVLDTDPTGREMRPRPQ